MSRNQLFIITADAFFALSADEVDATVSALKEANLYALPYPRVDIRIAGDTISRAEYRPGPLDRQIARGVLRRDGDFVYSRYGRNYWVDFKDISLDDINYQKIMTVEKGNLYFEPDSTLVDPKRFGEEFGPNEQDRNNIANTLIVLLATRNSIKDTKHRKSALLGIGKGAKRYEYTTTISVPKILEDDDSTEGKPTGVAKAPHLRRAHLRHQHHGPHNKLVKVVLIPPVFVNADKQWVSNRKAYNLSL